MRVFIQAFLALTIGLLAGWAVGTSLSLRVFDLVDIRDRDGGYAIASFFVFGPIAGALTGMGAAIAVIFRGLRRNTSPPVGRSAPTGAARLRRTAPVAALVVLAVYLVGWALIEFTGPWAPKSMTRSLFYNGIPLLLGLLAAAAVARMRGRATAAV